MLIFAWALRTDLNLAAAEGWFEEMSCFRTWHDTFISFTDFPLHGCLLADELFADFKFYVDTKLIGWSMCFCTQFFSGLFLDANYSLFKNSEKIFCYYCELVLKQNRASGV